MGIPPIKTSEHVFIAGMTGSGKTFLARHYLAGFTNVFAIDTKELLTWPEVPGTIWTGKEGEILVDGHKEIIIIEHAKELEKAAKSYPKVIYRPVFTELNNDYFEAFFKFCYLNKNCLVWIDEAMSICPTPYKIPEWYKGVLTRGRQRNVAAWSLTQRPSGLPQLVLSEASHYFIFNLNLEADRIKLANSTGCVEMLNKPGLTPIKGIKKTIPNFWYFNVGQDRAVKSYMLTS